MQLPGCLQCDDLAELVDQDPCGPLLRHLARAGRLPNVLLDGLRANV